MKPVTYAIRRDDKLGSLKFTTKKQACAYMRVIALSIAAKHARATGLKARIDRIPDGITVNTTKLTICKL